MRKQRVRGFLIVSAVAMAALVLLAGHSVMAETSTSNSSNYKATEMQFGAGNSNESCSGQYCARVTIGDDSAASSATSAAFGEAKYTEPTIEMIIEPGTSNLGDLSTERTGTKTTVIKIRNYQSGGYLLQLIGSAPKYQGHTLATPTEPAESHIGTEQFGINVVANTIPVVGANALQVPADQAVFGQATDNYNSPNLFMYSSGDTIARSLADTGGTDYTISMMVNISTATPAGHYSGDFAAVLVPAY